MGSHLWALSSPTFISLPATSLGRANLQLFTFTPWLSSPASVPAQPSHACGHQREAFGALRKSGMATVRFCSPQKSGIRELESRWECENSTMGLFCAPGQPHLPLQNLRASFALQSCPTAHPAPTSHKPFPETPMPAWHLSHSLPSFQEHKTPGRVGWGCWDSGDAAPSRSTCRAPGLLLHPAPSSLCS